MLKRLLLLMVILPFVELALLLAFGKYLGVLPALLVVVLTALFGMFVVRRQGLQAFRRVRADMRENRLPADSIADGLMLLAAGVLLIMPGLLGDLAGIALLVPACRRWCRIAFVQWLRGRIEKRFGPLPKPRPTTEVIDSYVVPPAHVSHSGDAKPD